MKVWHVSSALLHVFFLCTCLIFSAFAAIEVIAQCLIGYADCGSFASQLINQPYTWLSLREPDSIFCAMWTAACMMHHSSRIGFGRVLDVLREIAGSPKFVLVECHAFAS